MTHKYELHMANGTIMVFCAPLSWTHVFTTSKLAVESERTFGIIHCCNRPVRVVGSRVAKDALAAGQLELF